jgi:1-acyl-sn-glycerol-3-phosphate acyltransferase
MNRVITYPRRQNIRKFLKFLAKIAFALLSDLRFEGEENIPDSGPLLVIANHFSFIDPVAVLHALPYPIEFIGGAEFPHAPKIVKSLPKL